MSTASLTSPATTIPFAVAYAAPTRSPMRWVAGTASAALAIAAAGLSAAGHAASAGAALGDAWVAAMFAVLAVAAVVTGFCCGASDAVFGKGDRTLSVLGMTSNVIAGGAIYAVWC